MRKERYELFLVEDFIDSNGQLRERKLAMLADSKNHFLGSVFDIELTPNINGIKNLKFTLPVYYTDFKSKEAILNPRYKYIANERKVRLLFKDEYYDFIIKDVEESRNEDLLKTIIVTCEDAIVEELSNMGWALIFDENNGMGTAQELSPLILDETGWTFDHANSDKFYESEYINKDGIMNTIPGASQNAQKVSYDVINGIQYHFYGSRKSLNLPVGTSDTIEVIKYSTLEFTQSEIGRNYLTNGTSFYTIDHWIADKKNLVVGSNVNDKNYPRFLQVKNNETFYNNSLDQKNYKFSLDTAYTFSITVKDNPGMTMIVEIGDEYGKTLNQVSRIVLNIPASSQWKTYGFQFRPKITGNYNRVFIKTTASTQYKIGKVRVEQGGRNSLYNSDFNKGTQFWNFSNNGHTGNKYQQVLTNFEYRTSVLKTDKIIKNTEITAFGKTLNSSDFITFSADVRSDSVANNSIRVIFQGWKNGGLDQQESILNIDEYWNNHSFSILPKSAIGYDNVIIQIIPSSTIYITNIKLEQGGQTIWTPALEDEIAQYTYSPTANYIARDYYHYFEKNVKTILNLTAGQIGTLIPQYEVPEKIRTLVGEKSNIFNYLQSISELFECWIQYNIQYTEEGFISRDKNGNRIKSIALKKDIGKDLDYGIEYGLNLKGIKRTINTDEIVTKMYVENNDFEYAQDGIVSIAQSKENPSGETYIINFDYFVSRGLLPYTAQADVVAYNADLLKLNKVLDRDIALRNKLQTEVNLSVNPQFETLTFKEIALESALREIDDQLKQALPTMDLEGLKLQKENYQQLLADSKSVTSELKIKQANYNRQIEQLNGIINSYLTQKKNIIRAFNTKYAAYIREGVWQDDNYLYPDLFYRDAVEVSKRSGEPKVSYTISLVDLSALDQFSHLVMNVGDKTFVRDKELFLKLEDNEYKPQDVPVFISEIKYTLDKPEQIEITVQNFKSRFDDLFQRVIASSESLKLNEKIYNRAAFFKEDMTISTDILQKTLLENSLILAKSRDNTVVFDSTGITVSDGENPNRKVKIVSGGIFITKDGINYKAGITPDGVSIDQLTAGIIDTKTIQIWNAQEPRFLWDANGLIAYGLDANNRTDFHSRISFNHNGLIFSRNINQDKAELSLTWDGLAINLQDGAVKIGSGAGIVIEDNQEFPIKRVELGKINRIAGESDTFNKDNPISTPIYGMVLRNADNMETLITSDTGDLWLKRAISVGDKGGQDMAGISGITQYSQREIKNYIRNMQYWNLAEAQKIEDTEGIEKWTKAINDPISLEEFNLFKNELESDPIRFWSGSNAPTQASFKVHQSGLLYATGAYIEGDINAAQGFFKGRVYVGYKDENNINTGAGISGLISDQVRFWAGSPFIAGSNNESYPDEGLFKVYNTGKVYATNMDVHGLFTAGRTLNKEYKPTIFIAGSDYLYSGILKYTIVPSSLLARFWVGHESPNAANLVITDDGALYASDIHIAGKIEGNGLTVADININQSGIYTKDFSSSGLGFGWMINNDGTANFNNVHVRGELSSAVFKKNEIQVAGGNLLIRPGSITSIDDSQFINANIEAEVEILVNDSSIFSVNDTIIINHNHQRMLGTINSINDNKLIVKIVENSISTTVLAGTPVINYGSGKSAGILLSASGNLGMNMTNGAIIDMMESEKIGSILSEKLKLRVGDLTGLSSEDLPMEGYGLYADNVALKGNLFLPNAGIYSGSEKSGGENKAIRFWSGTPFSQRHDANFKVYEDGTVLARGGIFEGKIIASEGGFSGAVGLAGITINDNTGSFYIQKRRGNTENFNTIAMFSSDGITIYDGGMRIYKSLADQSLPKPNTFQYLYPYMMAINDTDANNERIVMRKAHFWSFDPESTSSFNNYSIYTDKTMFGFASGTLANQDKARYIYQISDFLTNGSPSFISYIANPAYVILERTSSLLGVLQKDNSEQPIMTASVTQFKTISGISNERRYELKIDVMMEYPDNEDAYLTVLYFPVAGGATPELLRFSLPQLKNTWTTLFKELTVTGYSTSKPFIFTIGVENSTSSKDEINNRLVIKSIVLEETTSTAINAESLAFEMNDKARIGMSSNTTFDILTTEGMTTRFYSINNAGALTTSAKIGINKVPTQALDVNGTILGSANINAGTYMYSGTYMQSGSYMQAGSHINATTRVSSYNNTGNYVSLLNGYVSIIKSGAAAPYILLQSNGMSPGAWGLSSYLQFYDVASADLRFYLGATRTSDTTGGISGTFPVMGVISNGTGNGSFAARGDILVHSYYRIPIIRSGTGNPAASYYPGSVPKTGDIYIRYI